MTNNPHIGSTFDDFLEEDGALAETKVVALKRVLAWQLLQEIKKRGASLCNVEITTFKVPEAERYLSALLDQT